jgi:hypothetical protein
LNDEVEKKKIITKKIIKRMRIKLKKNNICQIRIE